MKKLAVLVLVISGLLASSSAFAETKKCKIIQDGGDYDSKADLWVECDNGEKGYIGNDVKPVSVSLLVQGHDTQFVIENPSAEIRKFYVPASIPEVLEALKGHGITGTQDELWNKIEVGHFYTDQSTRLYKNTNMTD